MTEQHEQPTGREAAPRGLAKTPSGIPGFDEITFGGLPKRRATLVCGAAGAGKTLFGMQFLVRGIIDQDEPGVFIAFEETEEELAENVASLGFDLQALVEQGKLALDHVRIDPSGFEESGEYNLEGLFLRLELAIRAVGAKRVVIDTLENLFGGLTNQALLRAELRRLFHWLKDQGVSAVITAEQGEGALTRHGLEEYVSDCVILLDHRVAEQVSTRRLRIVKYRGTLHGTNEYPFLIDENGMVVMPITSSGLAHRVSNERLSSGIEGLDEMLGGAGYYSGSSVLISGTAGAGKSSLATHFVDSVCRRGARCLYFSFEESPNQIRRNMASIGLDLAPHEREGRLRFSTSRPTSYGLETHLAMMHKLVRGFEPDAVVVDPISNLISAANQYEAYLMVVRLLDFLKGRGVTALMTSLTRGDRAEEATDVAISSIIDTWLLVKTLESGGERNRGLYVIKSRGMDHSHQVREFRIGSRGVELIPAYMGPGGMLTGAARARQERLEREATEAREEEMRRKERALDCKRRALEGRIEAMRAEFEADAAEAQREAAVNEARQPRE